MFADVSGSSALYRSKGDLAAKALIDRLLHMMIVQTQAQQGRVVKTIGDEVMSCFTDCDTACRAAIAIQQQSESLGQPHLSLRIGIGFGKTIKDGDDLFGQAVNDAADVAKIAKGTQIVLTESVYQNASIDIRKAAKAFDQVKLKGSRESSTIYRLSWRSSAADLSETQMISLDAVAGEVEGFELELVFGDRQFRITPERTPFVIGRDRQLAQLVVEGDPVSREHCHIDFSRDKFVLSDHSTNGTYLMPTHGSTEIYLRRESLPLIESGSFSLGVSQKDSQANVIQFRGKQSKTDLT